MNIRRVMLSPVRSLWVNEFETLRPRKNPLSLTSLRPASGPTYSRVSLARALYHSCSVSKRGVFACRPEPLNLSYLGSQSQSLVSSHRRDYYMLFGGGHERGNHLDSIIARLSDIRTKLALLAVAVLGGGYYVYYLERIPETGRWRFIDVSREAELEVGLDGCKEILKAYKETILPADDPVSMNVCRISERILAAAGLGHVKTSISVPAKTLPAAAATYLKSDTGSEASQDEPTAKDGEWEIFVIKDDNIENAFVLPGGKIFVFTGILPICKTDDGLATVLGHEIAHAVLRHSAETLSSKKVLLAVVMVLEMLGLDFGTGLHRIGVNLFMALPNSRTMESEADAVGLKLMAQACFDPAEASAFWVRMEEFRRQYAETGIMAWLEVLSRGGTVGDVDFLSTHPANEKRIRAMKNRLSQAQALQDASPECAKLLQEQYEAFKQSAIPGRPAWYKQFLKGIS